MSKPVDWNGANKRLVAPKDTSSVGSHDETRAVAVDYGPVWKS